MLGEKFAETFKQAFVIENRSGAGGNIGNEAAAKSSSDGYTILVGDDGVASAPHAYKLNINPLKDLATVTQLSRQPVVLAVHPSLGVKSYQEFLERARGALSKVPWVRSVGVRRQWPRHSRVLSSGCTLWTQSRRSPHRRS
jgi:tripartite-type tricarboxylate transporter receptor subunit TctC